MVGEWLWVDDFYEDHPILLPQNAIQENGVPGIGGATRLHVWR
jgi:hypothetical protein